MADFRGWSNKIYGHIFKPYSETFSLVSKFGSLPQLGTESRPLVQRVRGKKGMFSANWGRSV